MCVGHHWDFECDEIFNPNAVARGCLLAWMRRKCTGLESALRGTLMLSFKKERAALKMSDDVPWTDKVARSRSTTSFLGSRFSNRASWLGSDRAWAAISSFGGSSRGIWVVDEHCDTLRMGGAMFVPLGFICVRSRWMGRLSVLGSCWRRPFWKRPRSLACTLCGAIPARSFGYW